MVSKTVSTSRQGLTPDDEMNTSNIDISENRSFLVSLLCGLYALFMIVSGFVICSNSSITRSNPNSHYYVDMFFIYMFSMAIVVMTLLFVIILPKRKQSNANRRSNDIALQNGSGPHEWELEGYPDVAHAAEGANFYMRIGFTGFSVGTMLYGCFKISEAFKDGRSSSIDCKGVTFIICSFLQIVFTFMQTMFIFKNHTIVVNVHKSFVKWCMWHLIATNLCVWLWYEITEIENDIREDKDEPLLITIIRNASVGSSEGQNDEPLENNETMASERNVESIVCYDYESIAERSSEYLFPCVIEYSLLGATLVYIVLCSIGTPLELPSSKNDKPEPEVNRDCHKANSGLFGGILIFMVTIVAVAVFFVLVDNLTMPVEAMTVFYITEIVLLSATFAGCLISILKLKYLRFSPGEGGIDSVLLMVSLGVVFMFHLFMIISSAEQTHVFGFIGVLSIIVSVFAIIQAALQVVMIIDGMLRSSVHDTHLQSKPGRSLVTFVIIANLALWAINTFEAKKAGHSGIHAQYYGKVVWSIIQHVSIPLVIFYRFHSTICLSDIWINAYIKKED